MSNHQRGYGESGWPDFVPLPSYVTTATAKRKAFTAFCRGTVFGTILATCAFIGSAAWGETITIGNIYINGSQQQGTTVTLAPSDVPGQLAIVTFQNAHVNQGADNGDYPLAMGDELTVGISYQWDKDPVIGSDAITVIVPPGITCLPADCTVTVLEGFTGTVVLMDWIGG